MGDRRSNNLIATEIWKKTCKSLAHWMLGRRRLSSCFLQLLLLILLFSWTWLSFLIFVFLKFFASAALFFCDNRMYVQYYFYASCDWSVREPFLLVRYTWPTANIQGCMSSPWSLLGLCYIAGFQPESVHTKF